MAYGLRVTNNSGYVQIDETYRNLLLVASGQADAATVAAAGGVISFPTQPTAPMVFYQPTSDSVVLRKLSVENDKFTITGSGVFNYAVYGVSSPVLDSGSNGLRVNDSSGNLIYDSRHEAVRIQQVLTQTLPWPDYWNGAPYGTVIGYPFTINFSSWGERPWILLNSAISFYDDDDSYIYITTVGTSAIKINYSSYNSHPYYQRSVPGGVLRIPIARRFG